MIIITIGIASAVIIVMVGVRDNSRSETVVIVAAGIIVVSQIAVK